MAPNFLTFTQHFAYKAGIACRGLGNAKETVAGGRRQKEHMQTVNLRARFSRRIPDPLLSHGERHVFLCAVEDIPEDLPYEQSNVREQNIDKRIYREVAKHLRNEDGTRNTFHLKNKGITILAAGVQRTSDELYTISFDEPTQGIVDGGHTYRIVRENKQRILESNSARDAADKISQFVKIEVLTGLDTALGNEIARGLNTAVQVQEMTLANHAKEFEWIKDELRYEPYFESIAFKQFEDKPTDVVEILRILELFNITLYPNHPNESRHPTRAYTGKENVLASYLKDKSAIMRLRPILKDVLRLHDTISYEAPILWNTNRGGKSGSLSFVEGGSSLKAKTKPVYTFHYISKTSDRQLYRGVLYPMLAAFRWMVIDDENGGVRWRVSYDDTYKLWQTVAVKLMEATHATSQEVGRSPDAVGKSSNHWGNLYNQVLATQLLMSQMPLFSAPTSGRDLKKERNGRRLK